MAISRQDRSNIEKGDFESIEDRWLSRMSETPDDLDYFIGVARTLVGNNEDERATFLLEMLDEQVVRHKAWERRLKLLQRAGKLLREEAEALHADILETLGKLHGKHSEYAGLVEEAGLHRAPHDIPKTWQKVERLRDMMPYDVGAAVWMEGKGAGRITEVNLALSSFRVDLERQSGLSVGFRAAAKMLMPLPEGHVLRRKLEEPEALAKLAESDPSELLRVVLTSYDRPMKAGDVRQALAGIVADSRWTGWWAAARKHQQVITGAGGRQTYSWAESSSDALDSVWQTFEAGDPRRRLDLLRRDGGRDAELAERMRGSLEETATKAAAASSPAGAALAIEIYLALERDAAASGGAPDDPVWGPRRLLAEVGDPGRVLAGIADKGLRLTAYQELSSWRDDPVEVYLEALTSEEEPRCLDVLIDGASQQEPERLGRFVDGLLAQPHRAPAAFIRLAERASDDVELRQRNPLRLFQQLINAFGRDEFAAFKNRLLALIEAGGTIPRLLGDLNGEQAAQAEEAVGRAPGLESYQREDLVQALHLRFPELRREAAIQPLYALPPSIDAKRKELKHLLSKEIPTNRKAIEEARALGDLRENFEYKSARQRHEFLTARAEELKNQLTRARPIEPTTVGPSQVRIGCVVELVGDDGQTRRLTLLGPWESDPEAGIVSYESEMGKQLLGKEPGDRVAYDGGEHEVGAIAAYEG